MSQEIMPGAPKPEEQLEIAEKVRTGEYFREARVMYDMSVHDPMAERYMYIFITVMSVFVFLFSFSAMQNLYPLNSEVPLIVDTNDPYEDIPRIRHLTTVLGGESNATKDALLDFMVRHYVTIREQYSIATFDRDVNGIKSQSSPDVAREYDAFIDPQNPDSPITVYQRHSKRRVNVLSVRQTSDPAEMEVYFEAVIESKSDIKKSHWRANIAFNYSGVELDESTGKPKPVSFIVTKYSSKRLQDVK